MREGDHNCEIPSFILHEHANLVMELKVLRPESINLRIYVSSDDVWLDSGEMTAVEFKKILKRF